MQLFCLNIKPHINIDHAWEDLTKTGVQLLYSSEDEENGKVIYCMLPEDHPSTNFLHLVESISPTQLVEPSWHDQWEAHGLDYHDGFVHISVKDFGFKGEVLPAWSVIKLEPGPGFGDLSHPTTNLVLELMCKHVKGQAVLDVGCGSGVLALCANAMGAKVAYGLDIDSEAVRHARQNALLNKMEKSTHFLDAQSFNLLNEEGPFIMAMNMIRSEQEVAWKSLKKHHQKVHMCLTSGVLAEERGEYLKQAKRWGWILQEEVQQGQWLGFQFNLANNAPNRA